MKLGPLNIDLSAGTWAGWIVCGAFVAGAGVGIWMFVVALADAHRLRTAIEQRNTGAIAVEDREFCTTFGMAPGTPSFARCASELARIRQRQEDRWKRDGDLL